MIPIESHKYIKGDNLVSIKNFEKKVKEFNLTFNEKRIFNLDYNIHNDNDKRRNSLFIFSFDKKVEEKNIRDKSLIEDELISDSVTNDYEDYISDISEMNGSGNNLSNYSD